MNQHAMQTLTLFDLLARSWQRPSAVTGLRFSADGSAVAFAGADGTVAIAATADREAPDSRIRVSGDLGQTSIRPRENPPAPLIATASLGDGAVPLAAQARSGFLVGSDGGEVLPLGCDGEIGEPLLRTDGPVIALDRAAQAGVVAAGGEHGCALWRAAGDTRTMALDRPLSALALSPDGRRVALGLGDGLSVRATQGSGAARQILLPARPISIGWSGDGTWLACALETAGFALVNMADGRTDIVPGFPAPVRTLCWSEPANALFAAGAFRIAGWSMTAPPFGGETAGALETGRAGMVPVEVVAAHPQKKLVAASHANGRITVAQIGTREEIAVRPLGGAVTALAWSDDGRHLAIGSADGTAAIITFPDQMFK